MYTNINLNSNTLCLSAFTVVEFKVFREISVKYQIAEKFNSLKKKIAFINIYYKQIDNLD